MSSFIHESHQPLTQFYSNKIKNNEIENRPLTRYYLHEIKIHELKKDKSQIIHFYIKLINRYRTNKFQDKLPYNYNSINFENYESSFSETDD